ncbi:MAG: hypothetical protein P8Z35_02020 [Ignavibacteriaceae bacterium]|jgi:hypothetical protein
MKDAEFINNVDLIENDFKHIEFEISLENPSYFRIAIESHNALLRAMVQALKGGSNFPIDKKLDKEKKFICSINNSPPVMIKKERVKECQNAWRFTEPTTVDPNEIDEGNISRYNDDYKKYLVGFYDLLAMIQCDYFMKYFSSAETIIINSKDLATLDWLHEKIRNEYEHFIPKAYGAPTNDLLYSAIMCLDICNKLLVETSNIYLLQLKDRFKKQIKEITNKLNDNFK